MLRAISDAEVVEDFKYDNYWGIGREGTGSNTLGEILMQVREALRESAQFAE